MAYQLNRFQLLLASNIELNETSLKHAESLFEQGGVKVKKTTGSAKRTGLKREAGIKTELEVHPVRGSRAGFRGESVWAPLPSVLPSEWEPSSRPPGSSWRWPGTVICRSGSFPSPRCLACPISGTGWGGTHDPLPARQVPFSKPHPSPARLFLLPGGAQSY